MAAGCAAEEARLVGGRVAILDKNRNPRWSEVWENNPDIATIDQWRRDQAMGHIVNGPGCRPYITAWQRGPDMLKCVFSFWRARDHRGRIFLSSAEEGAGRAAVSKHGGFVVIEPNLARISNPNKQWPRERYQALVDELRDVEFVQLGPAGTELLHGVMHIETPTFRAACAVLSAAAAYVGPEGGLHHAAAALGVRAVVIFGGHTDPLTTGYPEHINLRGKQNRPACGNWKPCAHCAEAMDSISVSDVSDALHSILGVSG